MIDNIELFIVMSNFGNCISNYFFQHEIKHSSTCGGGGASTIVARVLLGPDVSLTYIHPKDVSFHISTCKFFQLLSRRKQHLFSEIISLTKEVVAQCLSNQKEMSKSSGMDLYFPSNYRQLSISLTTLTFMEVCPSSKPTLSISEKGDGPWICFSCQYSLSLTCFE